VSAAAFDPWAALAKIREQAGAAPNPANPAKPTKGAAGRLGELDGLGEAPAVDGWCADIALSIRTAVAEGAEREADPDGFLVLVRPDGGRLVVTPATLASLEAAGVLPPLPPAVGRSMHAASARPPCWSDPDDLPVEGDRCRCGSMRFWTERGRRCGWLCSTCRPPLHLGADDALVVTTERTER